MLPRTMLRKPLRREITLGDLRAKRGILGGITVIAWQPPDHPRPSAEADLELLDEPQMPPALNASL